MRLLSLGLLALVLEVGWLALWPLSVALSHSPAFTSDVLATHAAAARLLQLSLGAERLILPALTDTPIAAPLGSSAYTAPTIALAAVMVFLAAAYLVSLSLLDRGLSARRGAIWIVLAAALVFQTTLVFLPGLFSQDVFSYVAYGRLAAIYDLNPYVWPPSAIPRDAVLPWVAGVWRTYAAPYGPVWLDVQWLMARGFGGRSIPDQAIMYRLLAQTLLLVNLGLAWLALKRMMHLDRAQPITALAALAWNPLVLFELGANAHNDVLMVTFSLLAVVLAASPPHQARLQPGRSLAGAALLGRQPAAILGLFARFRNDLLSAASFTVGALVKYLSGIGLVWVAVACAARASSWKGRVLRLTMVGLLSTGIGLAVAWPWLELPDSLEPILAETVSVGFVNALPDSLALALADQVLGPAGVPLARELTRSVARLLGLASFGVYLFWEARRVWLDASSLAVVRATARSCLIYILVVSTSMQTWYLCLPVAVVVLLGWRASLTRVIVGYSVLTVPALYLSYYLRDTSPAWVNLVYALAPLAPVCIPVVLRRASVGAHETSRRGGPTARTTGGAAGTVRGAMKVDFWFDPICPWAWITSRWLLEVAPMRALDIHWHVMSLSVLNEGREHLSDDYKKRMRAAWGPVRVLIAARQRSGEDVVLPLYTELGNQFHLQKAEIGRPAIEAALRQLNLPTDLADAMSSTDYDDDLRDSHKDGIDRVGMEVGTPIISVEGASFFGPVVTPMPRGEAAAKLWDGVLLVAGTDGFFELKRTRDRHPEFSASTS